MHLVRAFPPAGGLVGAKFMLLDLKGQDASTLHPIYAGGKPREIMNEMRVGNCHRQQIRESRMGETSVEA